MQKRQAHNLPHLGDASDPNEKLRTCLAAEVGLQDGWSDRMSLKSSTERAHAGETSRHRSCTAPSQTRKRRKEKHMTIRFALLALACPTQRQQSTITVPNVMLRSAPCRSRRHPQTTTSRGPLGRPRYLQKCPRWPRVATPGTESFGRTLPGSGLRAQGSVLSALSLADVSKVTDEHRNGDGKSYASQESKKV